MLTLATSTVGVTLSLLATFLGIGALANALIFYIVVQVIGERRENQARRSRNRSQA